MIAFYYLDFSSFFVTSNCFNNALSVDELGPGSLVSSADLILKVSLFDVLRFSSCNLSLASVLGVLHIDSVSCFGSNLAAQLASELLSKQYLQNK